MELVIVSNKQEVTKSRIFTSAIFLILLLLISLITVTTVTDPPVHSELTKEVPVEFIELNFDPTKDQGGSPGGSGKASDEILNKTNPPQQTGVVTTTDPNATAIQSGNPIKQLQKNHLKTRQQQQTTPIQFLVEKVAQVVEMTLEAVVLLVTIMVKEVKELEQEVVMEVVAEKHVYATTKLQLLTFTPIH